MTQLSIPAAFIRGGTSKAIVLKLSNLPDDRDAWPKIFAAIMGSPDPNMRQLDGMGGGSSSLSKICIIGPSTRPDADINYTFAQVSVKDCAVDFSGNCGNMSSAIGPFAFDEGLVAPTADKSTIVRIHNTNSGKVITSEFAIQNGRTITEGDTEIPGVHGTGAPVSLTFLDPANTLGRGILPSGKPVDALTLPNGIQLNATMIDAAIPSVFVTAADIGGDTTLPPAQIDADTALMDRLEALRCAASQRMGITPDATIAAKRIATPKIAMIAPPRDYTDLSGKLIAGADHDIQIRMISAGQAHGAVPVTGALALACAAVVNGSIVAATLSPNADPLIIRIGTPSGIVTVGAQYDATTDTITSAKIVRTQRRLMQGVVFIPNARL